MPEVLNVITTVDCPELQADAVAKVAAESLGAVITGALPP